MTFISEQKVLNSGIVRLISVSGSDLTPVEAARTSNADFAEDFTQEQNENLVDYLLRKDHGSVFEFPDVTFYLKLPIFVARQLIRNRVGVSLNELSLRYSEAPEEFWIPSTEECKQQSTNNKQGSSKDLVKDPEFIREVILNAGHVSQEHYSELLNHGLSRETARTVLPLGQYTVWNWKVNLRALLYMLHQRLGDLAGNNLPQEQTKAYAQSMLELVEPHFPVIFRAWRNHVHGAVTFSADECLLLGELIKEVTDKDIGALEHNLRGSRMREFKNKISILLEVKREEKNGISTSINTDIAQCSNTTSYSTSTDVLTKSTFVVKEAIFCFTIQMFSEEAEEEVLKKMYYVSSDEVEKGTFAKTAYVTFSFIEYEDMIAWMKYAIKHISGKDITITEGAI